MDLFNRNRTIICVTDPVRKNFSDIEIFLFLLNGVIVFEEITFLFCSTLYTLRH